MGTAAGLTSLVLSQPSSKPKLADLCCMQVAAHSSSSAYWSMLGLVLAQLDGLALGYSARHEHEQDNSTVPLLSFTDFLFINGNGKP